MRWAVYLSVGEHVIGIILSLMSCIHLTFSSILPHPISLLPTLSPYLDISLSLPLCDSCVCVYVCGESGNRAAEGA